VTAFSVVMPAYNAARTLPSAFASLERQRERDFEVIVVDDGSSDATVAVAQAFCEPRGWRVISQANAGPSAARNAGIRAATGRWIAFYDSDDILLPSHLELMRAMLTSRPGLRFAFADAWVWDEGRGRFERRSANGRNRPRPLPEETWELFRCLLMANFVFIGCCLDRELALELGGFDERLRAAEDWELWLRVVASGAGVVATERRQAVYRVSAGQASADARFMWEGILAVLNGVQDKCDLPAGVAAQLERRIEIHLQSRPGESLPRGPSRDLLSRSTRWAAPVRDYRFTRPRAVAPVADLI
jgi:glycosyltransferase involved in cell wall biosynthesis